MTKQLTTKQKCEKLAKMLEVVAVKLKDTSLGEAMWETEELAVQTLVAQVTKLLSAAKKISEIDSRTSRTTSKKIKDTEDWPDIIL